MFPYKSWPVKRTYIVVQSKKYQFSSLLFCGPHSKLNGVRGLSKQYHMIFDPKLVRGICENTSYTLCLCLLYIYDIQTMDSWFDTITTTTLTTCHKLHIMMSYRLI